MHKGEFDLSAKCSKVKPRVIIGRNLVVLEYPMLHTMFQDDYRLFSFGEEDFLRFLPYMGMTAMVM